MQTKTPVATIAFALCAVVTIAACIHPGSIPPAPVRSTEYSMDLLIEALVKYRELREDMPVDLQSLCSEGVWCETPQHVGYTLEDAWGSRFRYLRLSPSDYELRSFGPDRLEETADDIVHSPGTEARRVRRLQGCYEILGTVDWFPRSGQLRLDTNRIGVRDYGAGPVVDLYVGPLWEVRGADSLAVRWLAPEGGGPVLRLSEEDASLVGFAFAPGLRGRTAIRAVRVPCR